jgi:DNA-binding XRE family transcriptional regulator
MAPRNDGRQRAARAVAVRRGELGMTQQELADKAGVDVKTVGSLETRGRWPIARSRVSIERALRWPSGEMDRIATAPDPAPRPEPIPDEVLRVIRKYYTPEQQREAIETLEAIERERRRGEELPPSQQHAG